MAKITENLKNTMKGFEIGKKTTINDLATKLGKTPNSVRSTVSVLDYQKYFIKETTFDSKLDKKVVFYQLSELGIDLINNDFKTQEENN